MVRNLGPPEPSARRLRIFVKPAPATNLETRSPATLKKGRAWTPSRSITRPFPCSTMA
jgi:hypothetical protein